jgi:hypothetical protein
MLNRKGGILWMGSNMMGGGSFNPNDYVTQKYDLKLKGNHIGSIEIGFIGPFTVSESEIRLTQDIS